MNKKEILKLKNPADLERALVSEREGLRQFRFAVSQAKIKSVKIGRETRKNIARTLTRLAQIRKA